jgi:hypothetical protein
MSTEAIDPPRHGPTDDHLVHEVVGAPLTAVEAGVAIALGVVALLLAGSMPVLLGALASEHRLAITQIGVTAMGEALTMGLAAAGFGALVKPARLRLIGLVAVLALAAINLAMVWAGGLEVMGLRAMAGVAEGVLLWITIGMIARSETPERWAGVFYASLTLCQFILTGVLTAVVVPHWHASGGFALAAGLVLLSAPIALFGRDRYAPLPDGATTAGAPPPRGWVALAASLLFAAAFGAVAIYTVPLARQAGLSEGVAGAGITAALATQILGGAAATALAGRAHYFTVFVFCTLATIAGWVVFMFWPPAWLFIIAAMAVGFVYMVATPFLVPMLIEADPSRRAAVQSGGAQLFGAALGPFLASRVVGEHNVHGAVVLAAVLLLAGLSILGALHLTTTRTD